MATRAESVYESGRWGQRDQTIHVLPRVAGEPASRRRRFSLGRPAGLETGNMGASGTAGSVAQSPKQRGPAGNSLQPLVVVFVVATPAAGWLSRRSRPSLTPAGGGRERRESQPFPLVQPFVAQALSLPSRHSCRLMFHNGKPTGNEDTLSCGAAALATPLLSTWAKIEILIEDKHACLSLPFWGMTITPLNPVLGAEIGEVDLSGPLSAAAFREIRQAFLDNLVLVFRNQSVLPRAQAAFTERFGAVEPHPLRSARDAATRITLACLC